MAQEVVDYDNSDDDGTEDMSEGKLCIEEYDDLESYILSNKRLLGKLRKTFFKSNYGTSKFVRITYSFRAYYTISNSSRSKNCSYYPNIKKCSYHHDQTTYIWSESALYLLGPKRLFWLTLFAINIPEADVTIELPGLCKEVINDLLS